MIIDAKTLSEYVPEFDINSTPDISGAYNDALLELKKINADLYEKVKSETQSVDEKAKLIPYMCRVMGYYITSNPEYKALADRVSVDIGTDGKCSTQIWVLTSDGII